MNRRLARRHLRALAVMVLITFAWQGLALAGPIHAHQTAPLHAAADAGEDPMHGHHPARSAGDPPCGDASPDCGAEHACGLCAPAVAGAMTAIGAPAPDGPSAKRHHVHSVAPASPPFRPPARA